ncbi:MAG: major facilitator transporter [Actinomycetia bacterium]|nr:major facilitator transporter [Actinomycetes bacterium]
MYLSTVDRTHGGIGSKRQLVAVGGNVLALGAVSLLTDISSEMVAAILPLYLVAGLGLGPAVYGAVDGIYTGSTALLRLAGGYVADRIRRRKLVAGAGYALSAVAKLGLLAAGSSVPGIGAAIVVDRSGKGLRTAPRDALITLSAPPAQLGRAFGVHRAMDSVGAFAGPLVALAVLAASGQAFDAVFVTSSCVAAIGVVVLVLFVRDRRGDPAPRGTVTIRSAVALLAIGKVRLLVLGAALMGLSTIGDGFVYLLLQRRENIAFGWFPLLAVGTSLAYLLLAVPAGVLADRAGRAPVFLGGYGALLAVYLLLASPWGGWPLLAVVLALYGCFYAATDGVLMALAGPILPPALRTTGLALVQSGQAIAYLVSSMLFGLAWQWWGSAGAIRAAALATVAAFAVTATILVRGKLAAAA